MRTTNAQFSLTICKSLFCAFGASYTVCFKIRITSIKLIFGAEQAWFVSCLVGALEDKYSDHEVAR